MKDRRERNRRYRERHREKLRVAQREYYRGTYRPRRLRFYKENRVVEAAKVKRARAATRDKLLDLLGGICVRCGEADRVVLCVDHIEGGGCREVREKWGKASPYRYLRELESGVTGKYQCLCQNCNWRKRYENKECAYRGERGIKRWWGRSAEAWRRLNVRNETRKQRNKALVIQALGAACAQCKETNPLVLQIDHVYNDGKEERRRWGKTPYHKYLREIEKGSDRYQLLCANDNYRKRFSGRAI